MKPDYRRTIVSCYLGFVTQSIVNTLPPLLFVTFQEEFSLTLTQITFITTFNFLVQLLVDLISAKFADKVDYRSWSVAAHFLCAAGLIGISVFTAVLPNKYLGLMLAVVLSAIGGGLTEVLMSPMVNACPSENKEKAMSMLHSFYCWGVVAVVVLSTVFFVVFGRASWRFLPVIWAIIPVYNGFRFTSVPIAPILEDGEKGMTMSELFKSGLFWLFILIMFVSGASEQAMSQWASAFAEEGLKVSKTVGDLAGPCLFSVLMGLSRLFYGKKGEKIDLLLFIILSSCLCVVSYLIAALAKSPAFALAGCALCGLSVGIMWPGSYSVAAANMKKGGTALFAMLALGGDLGCSFGPTLVGRVSAKFGENLKTGFLAAIVFPVILIISSIILKRKKQ